MLCASRALSLSLSLSLFGPLDRWHRWQISSGELLVQRSRSGERRRPTGHFASRGPCHVCRYCTLASKQGQEVLGQLEVRTQSFGISSIVMPTYRSGASTLAGDRSFPAQLDGLAGVLEGTGPDAGGVRGSS
jgi:hypothetical protein